MISVEDARSACLDLVTPLDCEAVALQQAFGRVLRADVIAQRDQPPFASSAMDGYAIRAEDAEAGRTLNVVGEAPAGHAWPGALQAGEAVRIFTGAPVPMGADLVVIQENVHRFGDMITLTDIEAGKSNIRTAGSDFARGTRLRAPRLLGFSDIALAAAMNAPHLTVSRRPLIALIATGDELVVPGEATRDDQIIASNAYGLQAMARQHGAEARLLPIARDTPEHLEAVLALTAGTDLIVTIGGASVGDHDLLGRMAEAFGLERSFYKVAMRPGKPLMAGTIGGAPYLGLPGNPVSALVCGQLFLVPMIQRLLGSDPMLRRTRAARLAAFLPANGPREHYMRARVTEDASFATISVFESQDSARLSLLADANALLVRPPYDPARHRGETVHYLPID